MNEEYDNILGQMAVEQGLITKAQVDECLVQAREASQKGKPVGLGQILTSRGLLTGEQLVALMKKISVGGKSAAYVSVRREDVLFGQLLVKNNLATSDQVQECLQAQEQTQRTVSPQRLGELMIKKGYLSFDTLKQALELQQATTQLVCPTCGGIYQVDNYQAAKKYICRRTVEGNSCGGVLRPKSASAEAVAGKRVSATRPTPAPGGGAGTATLTVQAPPSMGELPPEVAQAAQDPQKVLGKYVLLKELGRGGMGAVFMAYDTKLRRTAAVKFLLSETEGEEVKRFYREAQTAATLKHPNINAIYEVDQQNGKHYISMEYIDGQTLAKAKLRPTEAMKLMSDVAKAVDYAHSKGIIHRDLKPQNIMRDSQGTPYVMDFGLAKSIKGDSKLTVSGLVLGTPSYMPPEQALGWHEKIDNRSDIYSLGATLFELVCGRPPFKGNNPVDTLRLVVDQEPPRPSSLAKLPASAETIILKCLEKDPARRYQKASELAEDLGRAAGGRPISAQPVSVVTRAARKAGRHRAVFIAAAVCLLIAGASVFTVPRYLARKAKSTAAGLKSEAADLEAKGDLKGALAKYQEAKGVDPEDSEIPDRIDDLSKRIEALPPIEGGAISDATPQRVEEELDRGDQLMKDKKYKDAGDHYRAALVLAPRDAAIKAKLDEAEKLEKELKGLADLESRRQQVDKLIGDIRKSLEEGKIPEARAQLKLAEEAAGNDGESKNKVAEARTEIDEAATARKRARDLELGKKVSAADQDMVEGKLADALNLYVEVRSADPKFPGIDAKVADCEKRINDLKSAPADSKGREAARQKALPDYDAGLKKLDEAAHELYRSNGDFAKMRKRLDEALDLFGKALAAYPTFAPANQMRGRVYAMKADFPKAESDYSMAIQNDPKLASVRVDRGNLYMSRAFEEWAFGRWLGIKDSYADTWRKKAQADFETAVKIGIPDAAESALVQAKLATSRKDYKSVINLLSPLISKEKPSEEVYRARGDAYIFQIQPNSGADVGSLAQSASGDYEQALKIKPNYAEVLKARGAIFLFSDFAQQALNDLNLAVKINPEDGPAWNLLGLYNFNKKDETKAIGGFDQGVKWAPWCWVGFYLRGRLRSEDKRPVVAMADFVQAIGVFPDCWPAILGKASLEYRSKRWQFAKEDFQKVIKLAPEKKSELQPYVDSCNSFLSGGGKKKP